MTSNQPARINGWPGVFRRLRHRVAADAWRLRVHGDWVWFAECGSPCRPPNTYPVVELPWCCEMLACDERTALNPMRADQLPRVLGDELRQARTRRGWTRKDLLARLGWDVSSQTLGTYERGARTLSVARFVELADTLEVSVVDLLTRTLGRVGNLEQAGCVKIDLRTLADDLTPELAPLWRWARARLQQAAPGEPTSLQLDRAVVSGLAELCALSAEDLTAKLWNLG